MTSYDRWKHSDGEESGREPDSTIDPDALAPDDVSQMAADLLNDLASGGTAETVAARLKQDGAKGRRDTCSRCPVAVWLKNNLPPNTTVDVGDGEAVLWLRYDDHPIKRKVKLPPIVSEFINRFDDKSANEWPELAAG
jgi:hypothetical protein